ncbi:hypothetical protein Sjap_005217 [Stephania japonica]|uniref:Uncharacterized protein n=1 Tax=Stephania japonica TaxID=461633 RepID=A0AAP0PJU8_9MAGN
MEEFDSFVSGELPRASLLFVGVNFVHDSDRVLFSLHSLDDYLLMIRFRSSLDQDKIKRGF